MKILSALISSGAVLLLCTYGCGSESSSPTESGGASGSHAGGASGASTRGGSGGASAPGGGGNTAAGATSGSAGSSSSGAPGSAGSLSGAGTGGTVVDGAASEAGVGGGSEAGAAGSGSILSECSHSNLLQNGGFETGDLTDWSEVEGSGEGHVVTKSVAERACEAIDPSSPHSGSYLFSSSVNDGATEGTPEITLEQSVPLPSCNATELTLEAYVSGAGACPNSSTSDDTVRLELILHSENGDVVANVKGSDLDPIVGDWNHLTVKLSEIPGTARTVTARIVTQLDPGFSSIDIGVDDVALYVR